MLINNHILSLVETGQELFADSVKTLVFNQRPDLFENIDFENNLPYLEPFVFSYFHNNTDATLDELLFGYFKNKNNKRSIRLNPNEQEQLFIPEIGYLQTSGVENKFQIWYDVRDGVFYSTQGEIIKVKPIYYLSNSDIELFTSNHPCFKNFFFEWDEHNNENRNHKARFNIVSDKYKMKLGKAITLLRDSCPAYFQLVEDTNKRIALFDNLKIRNFASRNIHGMIFIGASEEYSEIHYLEEIIHQCGHNIFNAMTANLTRFFKVDPETPLGTYSKNEFEYRSLYSTLHGLFTIAVRIDCFKRTLSLDLTRFQRHELLGRLAHLKRRFKTGLELVNLNEAYTIEGKELYLHINDYCSREIQKINKLLKYFNFSNQTGPDFNFKEFLRANSVDVNPIFP